MSALHTLRLEVGAEILKAMRAPEFILPTLLFPVAFYLLFGVVLAGGSNNASYLLATYGVFAVMGPAIFGFGVAVANERTMGWLSLKRAVPAPPLAYIFAKIIATVLFASLAVALVYIVAGFIGGVMLERGVWALLLLTHILACIPFILIGLLIGFAFKANGAIAFANLAFMGLAVLGGLWIPVTVFPDVMQAIAKWLPSYHLGEIALKVSGAPGERSLGPHIAMIANMTIFLTAAVFFVWRRQRD